MFATCITT